MWLRFKYLFSESCDIFFHAHVFLLTIDSLTSFTFTTTTFHQFRPPSHTSRVLSSISYHLSLCPMCRESPFRPETPVLWISLLSTFQMVPSTSSFVIHITGIASSNFYWYIYTLCFFFWFYFISSSHGHY